MCYRLECDLPVVVRYWWEGCMGDAGAYFQYLCFLLYIWFAYLSKHEHRDDYP